MEFLSEKKSYFYISKLPSTPMIFEGNPTDPIVLKKINTKGKKIFKPMLFGAELTSTEVINYLKGKGFTCLTNTFIRDMQNIDPRLKWQNLLEIFNHAVICLITRLLKEKNIGFYKQNLTVSNDEIDIFALRELVSEGPFSKKAVRALEFLSANLAPKNAVTPLLRNLYEYLNNFSEAELNTFRKFSIWKLSSYSYSLKGLIKLKSCSKSDFEKQIEYQTNLKFYIFNILKESFPLFNDYVKKCRKKRVNLVCSHETSEKIFCRYIKKVNFPSISDAFENKLEEKRSEKENVIDICRTLGCFQDLLREQLEISSHRIKLDLLFFAWFFKSGEEDKTTHLIERHTNDFEKFFDEHNHIKIKTLFQLETLIKKYSLSFENSSPETKEAWNKLCKTSIYEFRSYVTALTCLYFINNYTESYCKFLEDYNDKTERNFLLKIFPVLVSKECCQLQFGKEKVYEGTRKFLDFKGFFNVSPRFIIAMQILPPEFQWMNISQLLNYECLSIMPSLHEKFQKSERFLYSELDNLIGLVNDHCFSESYVQNSKVFLEEIKEKNSGISLALKLFFENLEHKNARELANLSKLRLWKLPASFYSFHSTYSLSHFYFGSSFQTYEPISLIELLF